MIMGGVYLTYSAYFLSVDFKVIYVIMNSLMVLLYGGLGYVYLRNCLENIGICNAYISNMQEGEENIMLDSLRVKKHIIK